MTDDFETAVRTSPSIPISAEMLYQLSCAASWYGLTILGGMTVQEGHAEALAKIHEQLSEQAHAILTEYAPDWLELRVELQDQISEQFEDDEPGAP